jgi:hypothetical protein
VIDLGLSGLDDIAKTIDGMIQKIDHLGKQDMPDELVFWQTEDMRRQRPNTETPNDKTAETIISQRSDRSTQKHGSRRRRRKRLVGRIRRLKPYSPKIADRKPRKRRSRGSPFPRIGGVLRVELFTKLCDRMDRLLGDKLSWRT